MSGRSILIGLFFLVLSSFIVSWAELVAGYIPLGYILPPPVVIGLLFLLLLINKILKRFNKFLTTQEIAVIFLMMLTSSLITSRSFAGRLLPTIVGVNYFADPVNKWEKLFFPHIKKWLVPWDPAGPPKQEIVRGYYEGYFYGEPIPWGKWLGPTLIWSILVLLVFFSFFCLAVIMRKQWVEGEKLPFPLVQLPLEMINEGDAFLTNRLMWFGFAIPAIVFGLNGLQKVFPSLPEIKVDINLNQYMTTHPWTGVTFFHIFISFAGIGFFYLLPSQLLFSFWFFYLLFKIEEVIATSFGMQVAFAPHAGAQQFVAYQTTGAFFVVAGYFFYTALPHLKRVFRAAIGKERDDQDEVMPYRVAFWGLLISIILIGLWSDMAGMAIWLAFFEFIIYIFVEAIVMARSTAEGGLIMTEGCFTPLDVYSLFSPASTLGAKNLTVLAFFDALFTRDLRGILLPSFLDSFKLADGVRLRRRLLPWIFSIAIILSIIIASIFHLLITYKKGALNLTGYLNNYTFRGNNIQFFRENKPFSQGNAPLNLHYLTFFIIGAVFTIFLTLMRMRFWWWPFHPLGYAMSTSWGIIVFWFPILVAWILKTVILGAGGMRLYRRARMFFLGMIFGEFTMSVIFAIYSCLTNNPVPFFPWT
jgi:hypothetical protein